MWGGLEGWRHGGRKAEGGCWTELRKDWGARDRRGLGRKKGKRGADATASVCPLSGWRGARVEGGGAGGGGGRARLPVRDGPAAGREVHQQRVLPHGVPREAQPRPPRPGDRRTRRTGGCHSVRVCVCARAAPFVRGGPGRQTPPEREARARSCGRSRDRGWSRGVSCARCAGGRAPAGGLAARRHAAVTRNPKAGAVASRHPSGFGPRRRCRILGLCLPLRIRTSPPLSDNSVILVGQ